MTWPFENDTSAITKKLARKSLQSEKRRNLMVVDVYKRQVFGSTGPDVQMAGTLVVDAAHDVQVYPAASRDIGGSAARCV